MLDWFFCQITSSQARKEVLLNLTARKDKTDVNVREQMRNCDDTAGLNVKIEKKN